MLAGYVSKTISEPVLSFGKKGSSTSVGMFDLPWGVAVSDTDEIAVTDSWNHRVQIFDSGGKYFYRSFGEQASARREFRARIAVQKQSFLFSGD